MKTLTTLLLAFPLMGFAQQTTLNFNNRQDFKDAEKGFICTLDEPVIKSADGKEVYSFQVWDFLKEECPQTANKSLWRQSQINRMNGLYEVVPDTVYQIRGFDMANMTFIRSKTGWIVIDVLNTKETASAGYKLVKEKLGDLPIRAILITHPHLDHFGGIDGIVENAPNKDYDIIAPKGFHKHAQEENVIAGPAMGRRAIYMYGMSLPKNAEGNIGAGLGQTNSKGQTRIPVPTVEIAKTGEKLSIDGIDMEFIYAPDAEAPVEFMIYFPQFKGFCTAEEATHTMHNLLTLRGAQVRNGLLWSKHIDKAIQLYGDSVKVAFASHHWPTWGNKQIVDMWTAQRDMYRYLHDQTLNLANKGATPNEIAETIVLPASLDSLFHCRGYYGTISHNVKSQYQMYFGWFDGNPAHLNPLPPVEEATRYVEAMGGTNNVLLQAQRAMEKGDYRWSATILDHLVFAQPKNQEARQLLAKTYKALGYQAESGPWRNFYLTGAYELTSSDDLRSPKLVNLKSISELNNEMLFDFLGIQINGKLATDKRAMVNVNFTDNGSKAVMTLSNAALSHRLGETSPKADLSLSISKLDFVKLMTKAAKIEDLATAGKVKVTGKTEALATILSSMDAPNPLFNIIEP